MRAAGRALKLAGATILGEPNAGNDYASGCQIDALEAKETRHRNEITEKEEAAAGPPFIEAYLTVDAHRSRIARATKTPDRAESYEIKLRCSTQREGNDAFQEMASAFYNGRKQILGAEIEKLEQEARPLIATEAIKRHSFFASIHKKTNDALLSQTAGFHVDPPELLDEDGFAFVLPSKK